MTSICDICHKKPQFGKNVSHSHRRTNRRFNPNIQTFRIVANNEKKRISVCTSCIKGNKI